MTRRISIEEYRTMLSGQNTIKYRNEKTKVDGITFDSQADLLKYVKTLPEEARQDFMAVLVSLEDGDITVQEATQYIGDILRQYAPVQ